YFTTSSALVAVDHDDLSTPLTTFAITGVAGFTVDQSFLYWFDKGANRLTRASLTSPADSKDLGLLPPLKYDSVRVFSDDKHVYMANFDVDTHPGGTLIRVRKDGTSPGAEVVLETNDGFGAFAQDADTIYYTSSGHDPSGPPPYAAVYWVAK